MKSGCDTQGLKQRALKSQFTEYSEPIKSSTNIVTPGEGQKVIFRRNRRKSVGVGKVQGGKEMQSSEGG